MITFPEKIRYKAKTAEAVLQSWAQSDGPDGIKSFRERGYKDIHEKGLPTQRLERWKYTKLPILKSGLTNKKSEVKITSEEIEIKELSTIYNDGFIQEWLETYTAENQPDMMLWSLNNAYLSDGLVIDIPAHTKLEKPIELTFSGQDGAFYNFRLLVRVGEGAEATIIEHHEGQGVYWKNNVLQIMVEDHARLHHYRLQQDSVEATHTTSMALQIQKDSNYESFTLTTGASVSRNEIYALLNAENAHCTLNGVSLLQGRQLGDTTIFMDHKAPHCSSGQSFRTVLNNQARGVFQGKVRVGRKAQQTDAQQLSKALLLSEGTEMDTKPELKIYADDVKCTHGAATGQLDEQALFYLRSRGLPKDIAKSLLIEAFVSEIVDPLADNSVRKIVRKKVEIYLDNPPSHKWEGGQRGEG